MKGNSREELDNSKYAISTLNCQLNKVITFNLPNNAGVRMLISEQKNKKSDLNKLRPYEKIIKKPLQK